jgi:hypothetical protein
VLTLNLDLILRANCVVVMQPLLETLLLNRISFSL